MELYKPFMSIYSLIERVKKNKDQCPHVFQRLQALEKLSIFMEQEDIHQMPHDVKEALKKLCEVLVKAEELIKRFSGGHVMNQVVNSADYKEEFDSLNKSLSDTFITLSSALHIYQGQKLDELELRLMEQDTKLNEQEEKLEEQERKLEKQKKQLEEQENTLQRVETKLEKEMRRSYCALQ